MTCSVEGCNRATLARSLCNTHYSRWRRTGDPRKTQVAPRGTSARDRLARYSRLQESGCIEWIGALTKQGYGKFQISGRTLGAHRIAWEAHNASAIPGGMQVCHTCDNRKCVNPAHLFIGTGKDNMQDCISKGRNTPTIGEIHGMAKLTDQDIRGIRERLAVGETYPQVAAQFGVSKTTIWRIANRQSWAHVE